MSPRIVFASLLLGVASALCAAPLERELGDGFVYFRARDVPVDLPGNEGVRGRAFVLDLRFAHAGPNATTLLESWLRFHARADRPAFVLVNGATTAPLLRALRDRNTLPGVLVVGVAGQPFAPDIVVHQTSAEERRAYQALEDGASVSALTTDNPTKERNDEASLSQEGPVATTDESGDGAAPASDAEPPATDAALQRAIHLFHGLKALRGR